MRLDDRKGNRSEKSSWSVLNSELEVQVLIPLGGNIKKGCKTNTQRISCPRNIDVLLFLTKKINLLD